MGRMSRLSITFKARLFDVPAAWLPARKMEVCVKGYTLIAILVAIWLLGWIGASFAITGEVTAATVGTGLIGGLVFGVAYVYLVSRWRRP
jgi:hypothetical protein